LKRFYAKSSEKILKKNEKNYSDDEDTSLFDEDPFIKSSIKCGNIFNY
jgi:hypothetical protein